MTRDGHAGQARAEAFVIRPDFKAAPGPRPLPATPPDSDWALALIDADLGTPDRTIPMLRGLAKPGTPLAFWGYQADRPRLMVADLACAVVGYAAIPSSGRYMLRHTCAATSGSSGGPLMAAAPDGAWVVVGIGSMARTGESGGWAVPMMSMVASNTGGGAPAATVGPPLPVAARGADAAGYSFTLSRFPNSPMTPRRKASTQATKITPWITVTQAPSSAK